MKYLNLIILIMFLNACTDRDSVPIEPTRYDDLDKVADINIDKASALYQEYVRERFDLEQTYRARLLAEKKILSTKVTKNIGNEIITFGEQTLPALMRTIKQVEDEIKRYRIYLNQLSTALMELGRNPDEDPDIQKSAKIIEDYQLKYTELVINLENIYIAQVKLDLAPDKNQQKELESMINSARYLAAQVEDTLESNLD
jgi:hypothetical protein|tara:strand:- start:576 stop:1175 length:600 start_codon:yes stop_codon:yes gene_type:complete